MSKKYDAVIKVGSYIDQSGTTKNRYENVGVVLEGNDGGLYMLLKATFNPAGIKQEGKESVLINFYEPKEKGANTHQQAKQDGYQATPATEISDEIPF